MDIEHSMEEEVQECVNRFVTWSQSDQLDFVTQLLSGMSHYQHGEVNELLTPFLKRDFIGEAVDRGFVKAAEHILLFLDTNDLLNAEKVCRKWADTISKSMIWKKRMDFKVSCDPLWRALVDKCKLHCYFQTSVNNALGDSSMFKGMGHWQYSHLDSASLSSHLPHNGLPHSLNGKSSNTLLISNENANSTSPVAGSASSMLREDHEMKCANFYRYLYSYIDKLTNLVDENWRHGKFDIRRINCDSEKSTRGVYCLQYDEKKIICGLRDNTIKVWDKVTLECIKILTGHTGSVLCLQYDEKMIVSGSSDSTVRVWSLQSWDCLNIIYHHYEAVLHLRFTPTTMVTCSKDRSSAVWEINSLKEFHLKRVLVGHRAAVNVIDFDDRYIVSASGDRTIKVWDTNTCAFVRTLHGHRRGIACLQYRGNLIVSGSSDTSIRLWNIDSGNCLRVLEGHKDLVRCIRFDSKRIVSGSYDGEIKVWDLQAALGSPNTNTSLCMQTFNNHTGRVFRLHFDDFQIVSAGHDDTILIWDFLPHERQREASGSQKLSNNLMAHMYTRQTQSVNSKVQSVVVETTSCCHSLNMNSSGRLTPHYEIPSVNQCPSIPHSQQTTSQFPHHTRYDIDPASNIVGLLSVRIDSPAPMSS